MKDNNYFSEILKTNKVILAPMAGITFESYRNFCYKYGTGILYTEMVSDKGLIYESKETFRYLPTKKSKRPLGIQLFGSSPETIGKAIKIIESYTSHYDFIDINMGCSVPKVIKGGAGSALLKDLDLAEAVIRAAVEASSKPITVKVRLGWKENNIQEIVTRFSAAGASLIAIHPRFSVQLFQGIPHWDLVKDIQEITEVPIVVSGDIYTVEDAINAMKITKAKGVMVARGGMGNPLLITNINNHFRNKDSIGATTKTQRKAALKFLYMVCKEKGEYTAVKILRGILPKFFQNFPNSKKYRYELTQKNTKKEIKQTLKTL